MGVDGCVAWGGRGERQAGGGPALRAAGRQWGPTGGLVGRLARRTHRLQRRPALQRSLHSAAGPAGQAWAGRRCFRWVLLGLVAAEPGSCSLCLNSGRSTLHARVSYPTCRRYMRDLPVSYEYLLENLVDPSHIHVS